MANPLRGFLVLAIVLSLARGMGLAHEPVSGPRCTLTVELVDAETQSPVGGVIRLRRVGADAQHAVVEIGELVNRGVGVEPQGPISLWWVLPTKATLSVPATKLTVEAFAGLETELASQMIDLTGKRQAELRVPLVHFCRARARGHVAGNTHLHLKGLSKAQADRYLRDLPAVDGLDVVFVSYLERAKADLEYTSNNYTRRDLEKMSHGHRHYGHGQEHRHNFGSHGEGYGHILLLDIPYIIHPVSVGPGITAAGPDAPPLQQGIDKARSLGGKVVWAHNLFGLEDIPNWITGRVHANNIFDGSHRGSYEDTYYRYLNVGLRVPFSTGTDWFIYDFSRVYVQNSQPMTPTEWLDRLAAGRTYITNGPLLEFTVDGKSAGDAIELGKPASVQLRGRAVSRVDFKQLELVHNGQVVYTVASRPKDGHFIAGLDLAITIDQPGWLALRTPPPAPQDRPAAKLGVNVNEFGGPLFSHTSPVYVRLAGHDRFDRAIAEGLLAEMRTDKQAILKQAKFDNDRQRQQVLAVYDEAIAKLIASLGAERN